MKNRLIKAIILFSLTQVSLSNLSHAEEFIEAQLFTMNIQIKAVASEDAFGSINEYTVNPIVKSIKALLNPQSGRTNSINLGSPIVNIITLNGDKEEISYRETIKVEIGKTVNLEFSVLLNSNLDENSHIILSPQEYDYGFPLALIPTNAPDFMFHKQITFAGTSISDSNIMSRSGNTEFYITTRRSETENLSLSDFLMIQDSLFYQQNRYTRDNYSNQVEVLRGNLDI